MFHLKTCLLWTKYAWCLLSTFQTKQKIIIIIFLIVFKRMSYYYLVRDWHSSTESKSKITYKTIALWKKKKKETERLFKKNNGRLIKKSGFFGLHTYYLCFIMHFLFIYYFLRPYLLPKWEHAFSSSIDTRKQSVCLF